MGLTREQVRHVAALARLALAPDEEERLSRELTRILEYVEQLRGLDVSGVEPSAHGSGQSAPLRLDEVRPGLDRAQALAAAPQPLADGFAVPRILEG